MVSDCIQQAQAGGAVLSAPELISEYFEGVKAPTANTPGRVEHATIGANGRILALRNHFTRQLG